MDATVDDARRPRARRSSTRSNIDFGDRVRSPSSPPCCASSRPTSRATSRPYTGAGYPKTLQDLIDFNNAHPELEGPRPASLEQPRLRPRRRRPAAAPIRTARPPARPRRRSPRRRSTTLMAANHLDAIVAPTNSPAWVTDPVNGDSFDGVRSRRPSAAGRQRLRRRSPSPTGFVGPLPVGVSFIGGRWSEPKLIGLRLRLRAGDPRPRPAAVPRDLGLRCGELGTQATRSMARSGGSSRATGGRMASVR